MSGVLKLLKYKRWQQALNVNYGNRGNPEIILGTVWAQFGGRKIGYLIASFLG